MSGTEALIGDAFARHGLRVLFRNVDDNGGTTLWATASGPGIACRFVAGETSGEEPDVEPMFFREDEARALLVALTRHFGGVDDTRALRKDYDAERARVDRLIGALIPVAAS